MVVTVFLVFLTADLNIRAKRGVGLAKYNGNGEKEIKEILYRREADEVAASKRLFGYDYRESQLPYVNDSAVEALLKRILEKGGQS